MKKYPIDQEFWPFSRLSAPMYRPVLMLANAILKKPSRRIFRDKEIDASVVEVCGYMNGKIELVILKPKNCAEKLPCLLYCHGGGFVMREAFVQYDLLCEYVKRTNCIGIMVRYRLAPRYPYPIPVEDCYAAFEWVTGHAEELNIDINRIGVGGESAGGNIAAVIAQMVRDRKGEKLLFQMLVYPVTDRRMQTNSMRAFTDTPMWNAELNCKMWKLYLKDEPKHIAYASPMEAEFLEGLPPAYVETAEFDCLRDEGIAYAQRLSVCGVQTELNGTKGTMHGFEIRMRACATQKSIAKRVEYMKKMFEKGGAADAHPNHTK